ncbi:E3 ubiquitin-protein ligase BOI-like [Daucus carota subsp. sativus]|uniref:E3 ubiquitin-protein ligase BOI-like n=1 Tax=Daucus carota subsp. sativus TaxID=79200 RepID=UPI0007EF673F|nr:PREDICTED: E3 ubiquitin-protein ligase BOI-like [Daucus carota subsp. sativus]
MASPPSPLIPDSYHINSYGNYQTQPLIPPTELMNPHVANPQAYHVNQHHHDPLPLVLLSELSFELNNRRENMQAYLQWQNLQTINSVVNENTNQVNLILDYASKLLDLIHEKENEVAATNHANWGLQMCLNQYDYQLKAWQQIALEKEALVANLQQQLVMIQESHHQLMLNASQPDAGSSCGDPSNDVIDRDCQMCGEEISSVVLLPCKHLCCCRTCEANVYSCPVCKMAKESSLEVSWPMIKKGAD